MNQLDMILNLHAWGHEAAVSGAAEPTTADRLVSGLTDDQLRFRPAPGANPLVWLIWHMARIEDVAANLFVAGRPQVLDEAWMDRLSVSQHDVGTGMSDTDVVDVSAAVDVAALCAYRRAVGLRTREIFRGLSAADLGVVVDESRVRGLRAQGVLGERTEWLEGAWLGKPLGFFVSMTATGHNLVHFGEAWCVRSLMDPGSSR